MSGGFSTVCLIIWQMIISINSRCSALIIRFSKIFLYVISKHGIYELFYKKAFYAHSQALVARSLPGYGKKGLDVWLKPVIFAPDNRTVFRAITVTVLHHHMDIDSCLFTVRTGDMQFPRCLTIAPLSERVLHHYSILYSEIMDYRKVLFAR